MVVVVVVVVGVGFTGFGKVVVVVVVVVGGGCVSVGVGCPQAASRPQTVAQIATILVAGAFSCGLLFGARRVVRS
jgi:hypothetical protein